MIDVTLRPAAGPPAHGLPRAERLGRCACRLSSQALVLNSPSSPPHARLQSVECGALVCGHSLQPMGALACRRWAPVELYCCAGSKQLAAERRNPGGSQGTSCFPPLTASTSEPAEAASGLDWAAARAAGPMTVRPDAAKRSARSALHLQQRGAEARAHRESRA